ncbi:hypothetical protein MNBD_GAMMA12-1666 [hydrothermal vent metagenome]|uniref:Uncharacterized protein n=1 Tax=hydrothermal vent metagenome TaxID=652676 RepID=A0A3B0XXG9_9ZZZZ
MLELEPISDENSYTAYGHTRKASEAFITTSRRPEYVANYKVYPVTNDYPTYTYAKEISNKKNTKKKNRNSMVSNRQKKLKKISKRSSSSISGQHILSWLGGATLLLVIAIGFKTFETFTLTHTVTENVNYQ